MNKKKVIAAGHICVDITPAFLAATRGTLSKILQPGKLIHVGPADIHTGGSVANTGMAMALLGADVELVGKVGDDPFGKMVASMAGSFGETLSSGHLSVRLIADPQSSTSYSVVIAVPGNDRLFLHNPGANDTFLSSDVPDEDLAGAALLHFGYPPLMRSMYEGGGEELVRLLRRAQKAGAAVSLDMAAVDPNSPAGQADWHAILEKALPYVDFFVPSVEELCFMLDRERYEMWQEKAAGRDVTQILDVHSDIEPLAEECLKLGCRVVLVKCGAPGMLLRTGGEESLKKISHRVELDVQSWADLDIFEKSYVPDRVLSGTGAGDTSIAAFLTALLEGYDPHMCLHLAAATGASCVEAYDALSGLKPFDELQQKIESGWKKNNF